MLFPSAALTSLAVIVASGLQVDASPIAPRATLLRTLAAAKGRYFGTAVSESTLASDATYKNVAGSFEVFSAENSMKGTQGTFKFTGADAVVAYAQSVGGKVRGHTLVWYSQLPQWVKNITNKTTLTNVLTTHINTVVGRYKGKILHWDVVNEAFNDDGTLRSSVWTQVLGSDYFTTAFQLANKADPAAKLYINDYSIETINKKSTALLAKVKALKAAGVPIHGVGFQAHLIVGQQPSDFAANLKRFTDLGLEVAITELDIRMPVPASAANLAQQAKDYSFMVKTCMANSKCVGVTTWGFSDKYSWVPSTFPGQGAALPWDANFNQKSAYTAIAAALA